MCFSPEVSFTASGIISVVGVMTLRKVTFREEILFASIPLLFASQQFIEGLLWLVLLKGGLPLQQYWLTQIFNVYADILWPVIVPISIFMIEDDHGRRNLMKVLILMGIVTAFYSIKAFTGVGISAEIVNYCIQYAYPLPQSDYTRWVYVTVTCLPFFLSTKPVIRWIGLVNIITFSIAYYAYTVAYISVWCFFAAVTSGFIYFYFDQLQREKWTLVNINRRIRAAWN